MNWQRGFGLSLLLLLAACGTGKLAETIAPKADQQIAVTLITALQKGDQPAVAAALDPSLRPKLATMFDQLHRETPPGTPRLVDARMLAVRSVNAAPQNMSQMLYELDRGNDHSLISLTVVRTAELPAVTDLHVQRLGTTIEQAKAFSFADKSFLHYLVLALAVLSVCTILFALVQAFRSNGIRRRWLWIIGILFGIGKIGIDWTTGAMFAAPLYISLFGAGVLKQSIVDDWRVSFGIPIVAIVFLIRRRRLIADQRD